MTTAQIDANRAAAVKSVRASLGLSNTPSDWTYEQRKTYTQALATFISTHPEQFGAQDLENAEFSQKNPAQPLEDSSFDWGMFAAESVKPIGTAAQSIGNGVLTVANASKWAIPLVVGILIFLGILAFKQKADRVAA